MLFSVAATAVKFVVISKLSHDTINTENENKTMYAIMNIFTDRSVGSSIICPSICTFFIVRGWRILDISPNIDFTIMTIRDTFIPPPVLPAHAPMNIRSTRICLENSGNKLKSVVLYPVVVIIDPT